MRKKFLLLFSLNNNGPRFSPEIIAKISYFKRASFLVSTKLPARKATPTDAAFIERLNETLKIELDLQKTFNTFAEAEQAIYFAVMLYNELRPHWSLNLKTPNQVYFLNPNKQS